MKKTSFFIVGKHAVIEALKNPNRKVLRIFLTEESKKSIHRENQKNNLLKDIKIHFKTKKELDKYTNQDQILHQGYIAEVEHLNINDLKKFLNTNTAKKNTNLVCLDSVTDPRNIGSIIRSAVAFNVQGIIVKERSFPFKSKLLYKSASGGTEHLRIFKVSNINTSLKFLKTKDFWISAFDTSGKKNFTKHKWSGKNVLLFGSEGFGLKNKTLEHSDFIFKIDINKKIESLNISNSVSIVCHYIDFYLKKNE